VRWFKRIWTTKKKSDLKEAITEARSVNAKICTCNGPRTSALDHIIENSWLKRDFRRQQFTLQFLSAAWGEMAAQERFDLARLRVESSAKTFAL